MCLGFLPSDFVTRVSVCAWGSRLLLLLLLDLLIQSLIPLALNYLLRGCRRVALGFALGFALLLEGSVRAIGLIERV